MDKEEPQSLFDQGEDWHNNACLNFQEDMSHGYIYGYKKAADIVVKKVNKSGIEQDYLVYPIVFLYRHHIEILLKKLIQLGIELYEENSKIPQHHKIEDLWPQVKGYFRKATKGKNTKDLEFIDKILKELCTIDASSMNFRYAKDKQGNTPNEDLRRINLRIFSNVIGKVSSLLEDFEFTLNAELELKYDQILGRL